MLQNDENPDIIFLQKQTELSSFKLFITLQNHVFTFVISFSKVSFSIWAYVLQNHLSNNQFYSPVKNNVNK